MIQVQTELLVADNTGAKKIECIKVWIYKGEVFAKEFSQETNKVILKEDKE